MLKYKSLPFLSPLFVVCMYTFTLVVVQLWSQKQLLIILKLTNFASQITSEGLMVGEQHMLLVRMPKITH